jgi:hypothetical protein
MTQEQISRVTRDLCQDCWQDANPTEYAPVATRLSGTLPAKVLS